MFSQPKVFFECSKRSLRDEGYEEYFDCLCSVHKLGSIVGFKVPCCDNDCGGKHLISVYCKSNPLNADLRWKLICYSLYFLFKLNV